MTVDNSYLFHALGDSFPAFLILPAAAKYQVPLSPFPCIKYKADFSSKFKASKSIGAPLILPEVQQSTDKDKTRLL